MRYLNAVMFAIGLATWHVGETPRAGASEVAKEGRPENVADSTPEAALRTFYEALAKGDANLARRVVVPHDLASEFIDTQVELTEGFLHLGKAGVAQFGEEGKALQPPLPAAAILARIKEVEIVEEGDMATWPYNPERPLKLRKVQNHWKLELHSSFGKPEQMQRFNKLMSRVASYVDEVADGIDAGRFQSVDEVRQEMRRQRNLMNRDYADEFAK